MAASSRSSRPTDQPSSINRSGHVPVPKRTESRKDITGCQRGVALEPMCATVLRNIVAYDMSQFLLQRPEFHALSAPALQSPQAYRIRVKLSLPLETHSRVR